MVQWHITIKGWRRFCVCAGRNYAAVSRKRKNVGEQNTIKGVLAHSARPAGVLRTPSRPPAAKR
jgi:hypothetical protein